MEAWLALDPFWLLVYLGLGAAVGFFAEKVAEIEQAAPLDVKPVKL